MRTVRSALTAEHLTSRRLVIAHLASAAAVTGLAVSGIRSAAAQDATPEPGSGAAFAATPVIFKSVEGADLASITVTTMTDPFTGYNPSYPPARGNRFLLLSVTAENVGPNVWTFDPGRIFIQDADGFVIYPSGVDLGPEPAEPGLAYQDVPPATTVSGVIGYTLVKGVSPLRAFFAPSSDRLLLLAEFPVS